MIFRYIQFLYSSRSEDVTMQEVKHEAMQEDNKSILVKCYNKRMVGFIAGTILDKNVIVS